MTCPICKKSAGMTKDGRPRTYCCNEHRLEDFKKKTMGSMYVKNYTKKHE